MGRTFDNYDRQVVRMTALNAIAANDLVLNTDMGLAKKGVATLPNSILNNQTSPLAHTAILNLETGAFWGSSVGVALGGRNMVELGDGNIALLYSGDGGSSYELNLNLRIRTLSGIDVAGRVSVSTSSVIGPNPRLQKVDANKIVIGWQESTTLKFAIYNNNGTVSVAAATVSASVTAGGQYWGMDVLANGDIVFAYEVAGAAKFKRYNSSGVLQGSETTIEAATCSPMYFCVTKLAAGGFVIYYHRSADTAATKFARYNSSGTLQGSVTTIVTTSSPLASNGRTELLATELTGGNIVFFAGSVPDVYIYDSGGSLVTSVDLGTLLTTNEIPAIAVTAAGFDVSYYYGSVTYLRTFTAAGVSSILAICDSGSSVGTPLMFSVPGAGYCSIEGGGSSLRIISFLGSGTPYGTPISISNTYAYLWAMWHSSGVLCAMAKDNTANNFKYCQYYSGRTAIMGVALAAAAAGETVSIATRGTYTLSASYLSGNFDNRALTVPGTRGTVSGTTATLFGMVTT